MGQQRNARRLAEPANLFCCQQCDLDQLALGRCFIDVGIGNENLAVGQDQQVHRRKR